MNHVQVKEYELLIKNGKYKVNLSYKIICILLLRLNYNYVIYILCVFNH